MEAVLIRIAQGFLLCMWAGIAMAGAECPGPAGAPPVSVKVDLNTATVDELSAGLKGIGRKKAEAIVAWRDAHGRFRRIEQLDDVKGIGPGTIEKNRDRVLIKPQAGK